VERATGGYNFYGSPVGILLFETCFARIPGDMGNATTWDFPVLYKVVKDANATRLIIEQDETLLEPYLEAARELEREGVRAIAGGCGFLAKYQRQLADAVNVPVVSSSLLQVPLIHKTLRRDQRVGIVTAHAGHLTEEYFRGCGWSSSEVPVAVIGVEAERAFWQTLMRERELFTREEMEADMLRVSRRLVEEHPDVGALVFECTNMAPYARAVQEATGRPVFDVITLVTMVARGVLRRDYDGHM